MAPRLDLDIWYRVYELLCDNKFKQELMTGVHDEVFFRELCFQRLASRDVDRAIRPHTYRTINLSTPTMVAALIGNTSDTFQQFLSNVKNHTQVIELAMRRIDPTAMRIAGLISECRRLNHMKWSFIQDPEMSRTSALYLKVFSTNNTKATFVPQGSMIHIASFDATPTLEFQPIFRPEVHGPTFPQNEQIRARDAEYIGPNPLQETPPSEVREVLDLRADRLALAHYQHLRSFGQLLPAPKRLVLEDHGWSHDMVELGPGLLDLTSLSSATFESTDIIGLLNKLDPDVQARMRYLEIIDCFAHIQSTTDDEGETEAEANDEADDDEEIDTEEEFDISGEEEDDALAPNVDVIEITFQGMQNLESLRILDTWRGIFSPQWLSGMGGSLRELSLRSSAAGSGDSYAIGVDELVSVQQHCSSITDLEIDFDPSEVERDEIQQVLCSFSNLQTLRLSTFDQIWKYDIPEQSSDEDFDAAVLFLTNLNLMKVGVYFEEITVRACCDGPSNPEGNIIWRAFKLTRDENGLVEINEI